VHRQAERVRPVSEWRHGLWGELIEGAQRAAGQHTVSPAMFVWYTKAADPFAWNEEAYGTERLEHLNADFINERPNSALNFEAELVSKFETITNIAGDTVTFVPSWDEQLLTGVSPCVATGEANRREILGGDKEERLPASHLDFLRLCRGLAPLSQSLSPQLGWLQAAAVQVPAKRGVRPFE